ncbi:hypothetical protein TNIN_249971 [Trichonephila inaurata madagascariensis]|uniref:Secreted protein n=1 Tax=Trichonephila inaurata madagascariensis TaxID=2747483 RepID=A0A8X6IWP7_9ARAC|nr:hypothetical protein TNIN_249971 [Trichonephila inaurata madagascariensis]
MKNAWLFLLFTIRTVEKAEKKRCDLYVPIPSLNSTRTLIDSIVLRSSCQQSFRYSHEIPVCDLPDGGIDGGCV